jgi:hypothetical protein
MQLGTWLVWPSTINPATCLAVSLLLAVLIVCGESAALGRRVLCFPHMLVTVLLLQVAGDASDASLGTMTCTSVCG